ncbi:MAG TPA: RagB/SusD family nutrient uptake outer membrane protein, partial [Gemmatimonas sp.]|nr:RagB/SusD family nutrient uptake outer membrane protein [Gemmatimonas sp.]
LRAAPAFTTPALWFNARPITRDEWIRVVQSFRVRADVYAPRNPAERAAVNWAAVLARIDSGITRDFGYQAARDVAGTGSTYINNSFAQNTLRISNRLLGPADTSGRYQAWIASPVATRNAITITTPDRRIHGATNSTAGTRFTRLTSTMGSAANGPYLTSSYRSTRYLNTAADSGLVAFIQVISMDEMKFIRAEALYWLNRGAEAATLINPTRIAAGLRPVDANGPPPGADCVPRKDDGTCGTLFDAIQYEKRIELYPLEGDIAWFDARGWGKLVTGTPFQLPVSGRELLSRGLPYYTFGGQAGGGAP